ncbi:hypothetical protein BA065_02060 [Nanoarchaeota archaeon NZ13-N]|nr:MAG: hypothetical protein BA065_02060 [Nanoarchaeota archaeon NZ13-N]
MLKYTNSIVSLKALLQAFERLKLEGLSEKSISNYKNALAKLLEFLEEKYDIQGLKQSIMQEIGKYYKWKQSSNIGIHQLLNGLTKEDVIKGFHNLFKEEDKLFYAILTITGLRRGEALSIKIEDIDLENRVIYLNLIRRTKRVYFVFINSEVKDMLEEYINKHSLSKGILFKFSNRRLRYIFRMASYENKKVTAQLLRKFFATYSIENGTNPLIVDFLQGRVSFSILTRHYLRSSIKSLRKEYEKVWGKSGVI